MKTIGFLKCTCAAILAGLLLTSCSVATSSSGSGNVPPGQAKKAAGSKSAKAYVPGQQKKH